MPTRVHLGAKSLRGSIATYTKRFDFLEVQVEPISLQPLRTAPSLSTLRKWPKESPPAFDFCVRSSKAFSVPRPSAELETGIAFVQAAVDALQARVLLLRTAVEVTPASVWRNRLLQLFERLRRDAVQLVWEPTGLWEMEDAQELARRGGVALCVDPLHTVIPAGPFFYGRLRALGETRSFGPHALEQLRMQIEGRRDAYIVFENEAAWTTAKNFRAFMKQPFFGDGLGDIIRPRHRLLQEEEE